MEVRAYTLEELETHLSKTRQEAPSLMPLSPLRLDSYLHNPRAHSTDPVLFETREEGRLVAYRTLLPDLLFDEAGQPVRFAWLSGNYVDPAFRRKGISTRLLQHVEARWEGRLMYTNYAPASKAVYDRTGQFRVAAQREGARFYLRSAMAELMKGRMGPSRVFEFGDRIVNTIREHSVKRAAPAPSEECTVRRIHTLEPDLEKLLGTWVVGNLFRRDRVIFEWILEHPWISLEKGATIPYPFSYAADRFENLLYRFDLTDGSGTGLLWLLVHNRKLTAPYLYMSDQRLLPCITLQFLRTMVDAGSAYATVRHPLLNEALRRLPFPYLSIRSMPQLVFVHQKLAPELPARFTLQDGDGDVVFTG